MKKIVTIIFVFFLPTILLGNQNPIDSLKLLIHSADNSQKVLLYEELCFQYDEPDSTQKYLQKAYNLCVEQNLDSLRYDLVQLIQFFFIKLGEMDSVIFYLDRQRELADIVQTKYNKEVDLGEIYLKYGVSYSRLSKYDLAVQYYTQAAQIYDAQKDANGLASVNLNIGNIYYYYLNTDNYQKALEYYKAAEKYSMEASNAEIYLRSQLNRSYVYKERSEIDTAVFINKQIIQFISENKELYSNMIEEIDFEANSALGGLYILTNEFQLAEKQFNKLMTDFYENAHERKNKANIYGSFALLYNKWGKTVQAIDYYEKAISLYEELGFKKEIADNYKELSQLYAKQSNFKKSLEYFQSYADLKDSLFNADVSQQINEMQAKYESDKKQKEIELLTKDQEKQQLFNNAIIAVAILILIVAFFVYRSYLIKKKANILLEHQNIEIREQKEQIEEQKQEITDSIKYASRIQRAVLPPIEIFDELFEEYFILFRPRDIVSGDFYWLASKNDKIYIAAADCTGHGVPGAFMSMLGISFLNEIINKTEINSASEILDRLRENVIDSLRQTGKANEAKDGMDIALCVVDKNNMRVEYAGAYNPLIIIRKGEVIQVKADKMPIGIYFKEHTPFTNNDVEVQKGDMLYLFSDGYIDQFGGPSGRKFMINKFKELLASISTEPLTKQRDILDVKIDMWRGEKPQIDDIIVLGLKI